MTNICVDNLALTICEPFMYEEAVSGIKHITEPLNVVVDVGANAGSVALLAARNGALKVFAVEPFVTNLCNNVKINQMDMRVTVIPAALHPETGVLLSMRRITTDGMVSPSYNESAQVKCNNVWTISPKDLSDRIGPGQIDFLKIDMEGHEWVLFRDQAMLDLVARARYVDLEIHPPEGQFFVPGLNDPEIDLRQIMADLGFTPLKCEAPKSGGPVPEVWHS